MRLLINIEKVFIYAVLQISWVKKRTDFMMPLVYYRKLDQGLQQSLHRSKNNTKLWK